MSGWIDPLGTSALHRHIRAQQARLAARADRAARRNPQSRSAGRLLARCHELGRLMALLQAVQRPGAELRPHKDLVQAGSTARRDDILRRVPRPGGGH